MTSRETAPKDWWVCVCVKRDSAGMMHIKIHAPEVKRCPKCGCTKAAHDAMMKEPPK